MATTETLELRISDNSVKAANGLNKLAATLQRLKNITNSNLGLVKLSNQTERFVKAIGSIDESYVRKLERVAKAMQRIGAVGDFKVPGAKKLAKASQAVSELVGPEETQVSVEPKTSTSFLGRLVSNLNQARYGISATRQSLAGLDDAAKKAGDSMNNDGKRGYGFIDSAKFLLKYQLIFSVFSALSNALKEGVNNLYEWSKATGGVFAKSMDQARSKMTLLKNSVATALSPAITALIPVFTAVANAVVYCSNAIAQLISAFRGLGTWTKATEAASDYADAVSGAGSAQKQLLASFDELNIISSKGGGGGGGSALGWDGAFEEAELSPFFKWVRDHMDFIKAAAIGIGAAILAWKVTSSFMGATSQLGDKFNTVLGVALSIGGAATNITAVGDAAENGVNWDNITSMVLGATESVLGLGLAFGSKGAGIGSLLYGVELVIAAFSDIVRQGKVTYENFVTLESGIALVGVALGLFTGDWKLAIVAGIGLLVTWLIDNWDTVKEKIKAAWETVKEWWSTNISTPIKDKWANVMNWFVTRWNGAGEAISGAWEAVKSWFSETVASPIKTAWESTLSWLSGTWGTVSEAIGGAWTALANWMDAKVIEPIKTALEPILTWIDTYIIAPIMKVIQPIVDLIREITEWFSTPATKVLKTEYTFAGRGSVPDGYSGSFGVTVEQFAGGGFVESGDLFIANEAGPELIGTIGGKTAVANNDQIVAGVANGVAAGQSEQNALLRKQNELLAKLLQKNSQVALYPSAALGRVNAQSAAMYERVTGVSS